MTVTRRLVSGMLPLASAPKSERGLVICLAAPRLPSLASGFLTLTPFSSGCALIRKMSSRSGGGRAVSARKPSRATARSYGRLSGKGSGAGLGHSTPLPADFVFPPTKVWFGTCAARAIVSQLLPIPGSSSTLVSLPNGI